MSIKRKRGGSTQGSEKSLPRKRSKPDQKGNAYSKQRVNSTYDHPDGLSWKPIEVSGELEDAEGFFGLEEIDNIQVLGDLSAGRATFQDLKEPVAGPDERGATLEEEVESGDEWNGIESTNEEIAAEGAISGSVKRAPEKISRDSGSRDNSEDGEEEQEDFAALEHLIDQPLDGDAEPEPSLAWNRVDLTPTTKRALRRLGFASPTPIQEQAIPPILEGKDVVGKAVTGSGKTLAYAIPIWQFVQDWMQIPTEPSKDYPLQALVLAPTRELARQIGDHVKALCGNSLRLAVLTGGFSLLKQARILKLAHVVVATPGRLWEMLSSGADFTEAARKIRFLVVDEADRLLSDGHFEELSKIMELLNKTEKSNEDFGGGTEIEGDEEQSAMGLHRQTLVFSATLSKSLQQRLASNKNPRSSVLDPEQGATSDMSYLLAKLAFNPSTKPLFIDVNPDHQLADQLKEGILECANMEKDLYLYSLLMLNPARKTLIFTNSISAARRIASMLQALGLDRTHALHSQMSQQARLRAIERFSAAGDAKQALTEQRGILVATDVAARGLDIPFVELVVHYHVPRAADTYIHRSGRTARSTNAGTSILLCSPDESSPVRRLVSTVHSRDKRSKAKGAPNKSSKAGLQSFDVDRRIPTRLKPRVELAAKIAKSEMGDERARAEDKFLRSAADDLGVEYDSEEFAEQAKRGKGRGKTRQKGKVQDQEGKADVRRWRGELRGLLAQRVNVGVSETYITRGGIDLEALLKGDGGKGRREGLFLGKVEGMVMA